MKKAIAFVVVISALLAFLMFVGLCAALIKIFQQQFINLLTGLFS